MKINPLDSQYQTLKTTKNRSVEGAAGSDFSNILEKTVGSHKVASKPLIQAPQVSPVRDLQRLADRSAADAVEQVLDHLECYQRLLSNNKTSLRALEPAVLKLVEDNRGLASMTRDLAHDDPVKPLLEEALLMSSKEVARFEHGTYNDE
jgi:hypothetical protein